MLTNVQLPPTAHEGQANSYPAPLGVLVLEDVVTAMFGDSRSEKTECGNVLSNLVTLFVTMDKSGENIKFKGLISSGQGAAQRVP